MTHRIPDAIDVAVPSSIAGFLFWMDAIDEVWEQVAAELHAAFAGSQEAARQEESILYVVRNDDLLGRSGPARAMVSAGLVSGARTAALEGARRGWTANVVAYDEAVSHGAVLQRALTILEDGIITGELVHLGPGHIGKALI